MLKPNPWPKVQTRQGLLLGGVSSWQRIGRIQKVPISTGNPWENPWENGKTMGFMMKRAGNLWEIPWEWDIS